MNVYKKQRNNPKLRQSNSFVKINTPTNNPPHFFPKNETDQTPHQNISRLGHSVSMSMNLGKVSEEGNFRENILQTSQMTNDIQNNESYFDDAINSKLKCYFYKF